MSHIKTGESAQKPVTSTLRLKIVIGLAIFAMFFGAGNLVFPLKVGVESGQHIFPAMLGFVIAGLGLPFLGLWASVLYRGDYHAFFSRLGKIPAFLIIAILMLTIGPFGAMPRTELVTYQTLLPYLGTDSFISNHWVFSCIYCALIFILTVREAKIVDIIGSVLSPVKIVSFIVLMAVGFWIHGEPITVDTTAQEAFGYAVVQGYSTMDMLASFFFATVVFRFVDKQRVGHTINEGSQHLIVRASIIGFCVFAFVYIGFMLLSYYHAESLQAVSQGALVSTISRLILGPWGGLFVCVSVSFACISTAMALAEVCSLYLYDELFHKKIPLWICLLAVMTITFFMSQLGFSRLMGFLIPILNWIYPVLIVLSIVNIVLKTQWVQKKFNQS